MYLSKNICQIALLPFLLSIFAKKVSLHQLVNETHHFEVNFDHFVKVSLQHEQIQVSLIKLLFTCMSQRFPNSGIRVTRIFATACDGVGRGSIQGIDFR